MATKAKKEVIDTEITNEEVVEETTQAETAPEKESVAEEAPKTEQTANAEAPKKKGLVRRGLDWGAKKWNNFKVKHPTGAKVVVIGGTAVAAGLVGYGVATVKGKKNGDVESVESNDTPLLGCEDEYYDDYNEYEYDVEPAETEAPVEEVGESTVEITEI